MQIELLLKRRPDTEYEPCRVCHSKWVRNRKGICLECARRPCKECGAKRAILRSGRCCVCAANYEDRLQTHSGAVAI